MCYQFISCTILAPSPSHSPHNASFRPEGTTWIAFCRRWKAQGLPPSSSCATNNCRSQTKLFWTLCRQTCTMYRSPEGARLFSQFISLPPPKATSPPVLTLLPHSRALVTRRGNSVAKMQGIPQQHWASANVHPICNAPSLSTSRSVSYFSTCNVLRESSKTAQV